MQLTHAARIARWWNTEQGVATRSQPVIKDWAQFRERPNSHDRRQPSPSRQNFDDFDPGEITPGPATVSRARVHLLGHLFARVRACALKYLRIVLVQPLDATVPIERLDMLAHPATEIAVAVGINFDRVCGGCHFHQLIRWADTIISPPSRQSISGNIFRFSWSKVGVASEPVDATNSRTHKDILKSIRWPTFEFTESSSCPAPSLSLRRHSF